MSKAKFTKGEWLINKESYDACCWNIDMIRVDNGDSYKHHGVIEVTCKMDYEEDWNPELSANAHLIAAAPEMYEMLEYVMKCAAMQDNLTIDANEISKLLAKARGEHV